MTDQQQHASDELCFYCAPDEALVAGLFGGDGPFKGRTIYMQRPESFCPNLVTHIVTDSGDNPEHDDDCPGCAAESRGDGDR